MSLLSSVRALRRQAALLVVGAAFGAVGAGVVHARTAPVYATTLDVLLTSSGGEPGLPSEARLVAQLARTGPALVAAQEAAGVTSGVSGVAAGADGVNPYVYLEVSGSDPQAVAQVADALPGALSALAAELRGRPEGPTLTALGRAPVPTAPGSPGLDRRLATGVVLGLAVGLATAIGAASLDRRLHDAVEVEAASGLPVLATVPLRQRGEPDTVGAPLEAYRTLHANLELVGLGEAPRSVLVTSAQKGDGKTTLAAQLAVALVAAGERVVVVDADLRRPALHRQFSISNAYGLRDVLAGRDSLEHATHPLRDGALAVLPAGRPGTGPDERLTADGLRVLLDRLRADYDWVIVDAPPVLAVADTLQVSGTVSGVLLVVRTGRTTADSLLRARDRLRRTGATVIGVAAVGAARHERYAERYEAPGRPEARSG